MGGLEAPHDAVTQSAADQFEAHLAWTGDHPLLPGRAYLLCTAGREVAATITALKYRDGDHGAARLAARTLARGERGVVNVSTAEAVPLQAFVLLDRFTRETVAQGTV